MATRQILAGVVAAFDEAAGLGTVVTGDGAEHPFHCTAIADGSRTIDEGAEVRFLLAPGRGGRWEATRVTVLG